jgi:hypothetical protein
MIDHVIAVSAARGRLQVRGTVELGDTEVRQVRNNPRNVGEVHFPAYLDPVGRFTHTDALDFKVLFEGGVASKPKLFALRFRRPNPLTNVGVGEDLRFAAHRSELQIPLRARTTATPLPVHWLDRVSQRAAKYRYPNTNLLDALA